MSDMKVSDKVFMIVSILGLFNIGLMVYQFCNFVISIWSIIPTVIVILVIFGNLKNMLSKKVKNGEVAPSKFGAPPAEKRKLEAGVDFYASNTTFPSKLTPKQVLSKIIAIVVCIVLAFMFSGFANNKKYDEVVTATIIDKTVEGEIYTEVTSDGTSTVDERYLVLWVSFEIGGEIYRTEIVDKFSHSRQGNSIDLCVNRNGEVVCAYDNLISYRVMFYACLIIAGILALGIIFKIPNVDIMLMVMGFLGIGTIALMNSFNWAGWLLKDFTLFGGAFLILSIICILQIFILRVVFIIGRRRDSNFTLE